MITDFQTCLDYHKKIKKVLRGKKVTMSVNIKIKENKTGDDSTETENSEKSKSNKRSEPSLDEPNPKYMKITPPLSKNDDHSFSNMSRLSHEDGKIPKRKKR